MKRIISGLISIIGVVTLCIAPNVSRAQADGAEQVIVTGMRISEGRNSVQPFISRRVTADFVWVQVICQSGSVNLGERTRELTQTFQNLVTKAAATSGLKLSGGEIDDGRIPIETVRYSEIASRQGTIDRFDLVLSLDTRPGEPFDGVVGRATEFARTFGVVGRSECRIGDEQKIGLRGVQGHRDSLLAAIAADAAAQQERFKSQEVEVSGLEARVVAVPATAFEMDLYIPYKMTIRTKRAP